MPRPSSAPTSSRPLLNTSHRFTSLRATSTFRCHHPNKIDKSVPHGSKNQICFTDQIFNYTDIQKLAIKLCLKYELNNKRLIIKDNVE